MHESESTPKAVVDAFVAHHRELLGFLERRLGDRALSEDILQDAFVKSVEHGGALRDDESARAWLYRMLRNAVTDHHRRNASSRRKLEALEREIEAAPASPETRPPHTDEETTYETLPG